MKGKLSMEQVPLLKKAEDFHGHLGPFLAIGVRMGLMGLDRLNVTNDSPLMVTASLPLRVPFSCVVDGLQITTRCTTGNRKLRVKSSSRIEAEFEREDTGQKVVIILNPAILQTLKKQLLKKTLHDKELRELAWKIASMPENELLLIP